MSNLVHLHVHDQYSTLDGMGKPEDYAKYAKELGMSSLAITNHGNVDGAIVFQKACLKEGIKPITGCEFYIVDNLYKKEPREKRCHINIWAKNQVGWQNILNMLTIANTEGFYHKPRIDAQTLLKHCDGVCIGSACIATFLGTEWGMKLFYALLDKIRDDVYLEVMPSCQQTQKDLNLKLIKLSRETNVKMIATGDCHYITKDMSDTQATMMAINTKQKWKDPHRFKLEPEMYYLRSELEMKLDLNKQKILNRQQIKQAINNTNEVANKCNEFRIEQVEVFLPRLSYLKENNITDEFYLDKLLEEGFKAKIFDKNLDVKVYRERLNMEMDLIRYKKFERYFLIVWEVINWCHTQSIEVGPGRGSAGGSLVCYLLGITRVDPIPFKLLFARFINKARIDLPDIDVDFEGRHKDRVRQHLEDVYGKFNVAGVSTFGLFKTKKCIRDIGTVFEMDKLDVDKFAKSVEEKATVTDFLNTIYGQVYSEKYPLQTKILKHLEGQIRGRGQHACGTVVSRDDLRKGDKNSLLLNKQESRLMVNWDKHDIEYQGLMKLDVLGVKVLTIQRDIIDRIYKNHNILINADNIPLDDKLVLKNIRLGKALGTFQCGTNIQMKYAKKMHLDSFWDVVHMNGLCRPGPLGNGTADTFINRKLGKEKDWEKTVPKSLMKILDYTYGLIIYQEQIMLAVVELADFEWATADKLRKIIAKSQGGEAMEKFRTEFVEGALNKGTLTKEEAEKFFEDLKSFGSYGFNLSHSVCYSHLGYWGMWFKTYYPQEFYCATLTYGSQEDDKIGALLKDAYKAGFDIRPPKRNISKSVEWECINDIIYAPFIAIKGIGETDAQKVGVKENKLIKNKKKKQLGGFFVKNPIMNNRPKYQTLIDLVGGNKDEPLTREKAKQIKEKFGYLFPTD